MGKEDNYQLELFSKIKGYNENKTRISSSFLTYIWKYEKTILIIICFIITGIISFSLGVEKGKRLTVLKINSYIDMSGKMLPSISESNRGTRQRLDVPVIEKVGKTQTLVSNRIATPIKDTQPKEAALSNQQEVKGVTQGYTIQVATYRTKTHAQKEAEVLRKRGLSSSVLSKSNFSVVCVGNFSNQKAAEPLLSKLKKQYQDCYIRRL